MSHYTDAELEIIRQCYAGDSRTPAKDAAERIGRSRQAVRMQAQRMGITAPRGWSCSEDSELCKTYHVKTATELARRFNRATRTVWMRARKLGITRAA